MDNYLRESTVAMSAPSVQQTPAVQLELQRLEKQHSEILAIVSAMEDRLQFIMKEPEPLKNGILEPVENTQSPLFSALRARHFEAESIARRLSVIMRRLDV